MTTNISTALNHLANHDLTRRWVSTCINHGAIVTASDDPGGFPEADGHTDIGALAIEVKPDADRATTILRIIHELRFAVQSIHGTWRLLDTMGPLNYLICRYFLAADALAFQAFTAAGFEADGDPSLARCMRNHPHWVGAYLAFSHARVTGGDWRAGYAKAMESFRQPEKLDFLAKEAGDAWFDGLNGKGGLAWAATRHPNSASGLPKTLLRSMINLNSVKNRLHISRLDGMQDQFRGYAEDRVRIIERRIAEAIRQRV